MGRAKGHLPGWGVVRGLLLALPCSPEEAELFEDGHDTGGDFSHPTSSEGC